MEGQPMVSYSAGSMNSLVDKLTNLKARPPPVITGLKQDLVNLEKDFFRKVAGRREMNSQIEAWMKIVRELVFDMEDWVDQKPDMGGYPQLEIEEVQKFKARIDHARELCERYDLVIGVPTEHLHDPAVAPSQGKVDSRILFGEQTGLVGVEKPTYELVNLLTGEHETRLRVLSIVGMEGLGKTTLAKEIYAKLQLEGEFECWASVSVGKRPSMRNTLMEILRQVKLCEKKREKPKPNPIRAEGAAQDLRTLVIELSKYLGEKRYFILVDGLWSIQAWKIINCALPNKNRGSRVLTTTCVSDVAKCCSVHLTDVYQMEALGEKMSRIFYNETTRQEKWPADRDEATDSMLKMCGGMPLAITVTAGLLATKKEKVPELKILGRSILSSVEQHSTSEGMTKILHMSYAALSLPLKSCLLYLSVFREDKTIKKDRLIRLWIAEGFIPREDKERRSEEKGVEETIGHIFFPIKKKEETTGRGKETRRGEETGRGEKTSDEETTRDENKRDIETRRGEKSTDEQTTRGEETGRDEKTSDEETTGDENKRDEETRRGEKTSNEETRRGEETGDEETERGEKITHQETRSDEIIDENTGRGEAITHQETRSTRRDEELANKETRRCEEIIDKESTRREEIIDIETRRGEESLWETGERYFNELIMSRLIQPVFNCEDDQAVGCTVHSAIVDFIRSLSSKGNFVTVGAAHLSTDKVRRFSLDCHDDQDEDGDGTFASIAVHLSRVRSITVLGHIKWMDGRSPLTENGKIEGGPVLPCFKFIRVLDLEDTVNLESHHLQGIGGLVLLKYLGVAGTDISKLPDEIGELEQMETLDLRNTKLSTLPKSIVKQKRLTHLLIDYTVKLLSNIQNMQGLEEVSTIGVDSESLHSVVELLKNSERLRVLGVRLDCSRISGKSEMSLLQHVRGIFEQVASSTQLRSLSLDCFHGDLLGLLLAIPPSDQLRRFELTISSPVFKETAQKMASLVGVTHMDIIISQLDDGVVSVLGNLPNLVLLKLVSMNIMKSRSKKATKSRCTVSVDRGFNCLKVFSFICRSGGKGLQFTPGTMKELRRLSLGFSARETLSLYGNFSFGIEHLSSLTRVHATIDCERATASEVKNAEDAIRKQVGNLCRNPTEDAIRKQVGNLCRNPTIEFTRTQQKDMRPDHKAKVTKLLVHSKNLLSRRSR